MAQSIDKELCRGILESAPDAILFADREGVIRYWNAGAEAVFGFSEGEALGQSLDLIIPERLRVRHWSGYHKVMASGETHYGRELLSVPALHKTGGQISSEFSIILLKDKIGQILGIGAIMRDVSKRRQEEKALRDRLAAFEKAH